MKADRSDKPQADQVQLTGTVTVKKVAKGSKSEHDAIYLETDTGDYHLRRVGANPFSDDTLKKLLGKKITARGVLRDSLFLINKIVKVH